MRSIKIFGLLCASVVVLFGVVGCDSGPGAGDQALSFAAKDASGEMVSLDDMQGKVVVLDFWATWCARCRLASPYVQKLHERYADDDRVEVIGVHWDTDYSKGEPGEYMAEHGYTYPIIPDGTEIAKTYGVWTLPQFIIVGPDGKIILRQKGFGAEDVDAFAKVIDDTLAGQGG